MKNWISTASLLVLLCSLVLLSSANAGESTAVNLRAITLNSLSVPLEARDPKKKKGGKGGRKGGHKSPKDDDKDEDQEDDDQQKSLEDCNNGTTCAECFGQAYVLCPSSNDTCYDPDTSNTEDACDDDDDDDDDDSAAASLLPGRNLSFLVTIGALGLMTAML